jgi:hypothetical protein
VTAFRKIKHSRGSTVLTWVSEIRGEASRGNTETTLTSGDTPRPEFINALQAFSAHVLDVCELPDSWADGLTVCGVSISENDSQGVGIVVTAVKKVAGANAPVVINTPHLAEQSEHGPALCREALDAINLLLEEADRFRKGERAQAELFPSVTGAPAADMFADIESVTISVGDESVTLSAADD